MAEIDKSLPNIVDKLTPGEVRSRTDCKIC
jgi:uncharacterized protein YidB (DUF937 family)